MHSKQFGSAERLRSTIEAMFTDDEKTDAVKLSTIHKAKGGEADTVYFLMPQLIPSKYAETAMEMYAERCLRYVAITRAKNTLKYVMEI